MLTVLQRAKNTRLVSIENLRMDLGLSTEKWPDARLIRMIDQASALASSFCDRTFARQIYRERLCAVPRDGSILAAGPVTRVISVRIDGGSPFASDEFAIDDGKLRLTDQYGAGIGDGSAYNLWHSLRPPLIVDYEAGWLLPGDDTEDEAFSGTVPLPADIEKAVIQLITVAVSEAGRDVTVKADVVEGVGQRSFYVQGASARLPHPAAEAALEHHRVVHLA